MADFEAFNIESGAENFLTREEVIGLINGTLTNFTNTSRVQRGFLQSGNFNTGSAGWQILANGNVEFNDGDFRGTITATDGTIGGFTIGSDFIRDAANSFGLASTVSGGDDVRFWAGDTFANRATAPFRVTEAGVITSTSGAIAAFTIAATTISATNLTITSGAANTANITVGTGANAGGINSANAAGDIVFWGGATHANRATAPFRVEADGDVTMTSSTISNVTKRIATVVDVTWSGTTTETDILGTTSIAGGTLGTDNGIRVQMFISDIDMNVVNTFTVAFTYGSTDIITLVMTANANITNGEIYVEMIMMADGATNVQTGYGWSINTSNTTTSDIGFQVGGDFASGSGAEDSTGALDLSVTGKFSVAAGSNVNVKLLVAEQVKS